MWLWFGLLQTQGQEHFLGLLLTGINHLLFEKFKKLLLVTVGLICLGLGVIGYVMPGLPGTIWLILAATFFVKSSDRLYNFVVDNRLFGRQVKDFLNTGAMSLRAKTMSILSMWCFTILSIVLAPYGLLFKIPVGLLAVTGTIYIFSRPTSGKD